MSTTLRWSTLPLAALLVGCPEVVPPECGEFDEVYAYVDADGDGYGSPDAVGWVCSLSAGEIDNASDCDDESEDVHPNAPEACDGKDNDCNDRIDEGNAFVPWYPDEDGDGFGVTPDAVIACLSPGGNFIRTGNDCDDVSATVNPAAVEVCNGGVDDDCDGFADDEDPGVDPVSMTRWYLDDDADGYGTNEVYSDFCNAPAGIPAVTQDGDCDDTRDTVNPGVTEICNRLRDDDCDGLADDLDPSIDPATQREFYADTDGDGYGDPTAGALACVATPGIGVTNDLDCDDTNINANLVQDWFNDTDGDGSGDGVPVLSTCLDPGLGLVSAQNGVDCEPNDPAVFPLNLEDCFDGADQNCNGDLDCDDSDCFEEPTCVPPCAEEVWAPASLPDQVADTTVGKGDDFQPTTCSSAGGAPDIGYWFTSPVSGNVTFSLIGGATWDTTLHAFDACGGAVIGCNDDFGGGLQSEITLSLTAGVPVLVVMDGYSANSGAFTLTAD